MCAHSNAFTRWIQNANFRQTNKTADKSCCRKNWLLFIFSIVKLNGTRTIKFLVEVIVWGQPYCLHPGKIEILAPTLLFTSRCSTFKFPNFASCSIARATFPKLLIWTQISRQKRCVFPKLGGNLSKGVKGNYAINQTHRFF